MRRFLLLYLFFSTQVFAAVTLNIFTWANYFPPEVINLFHKQTGITLNISTFDNNQILYTKLKASPNSGYDIVIPSTYIVDRMRKEKMLQKLDLAKIQVIEKINKKFLNQDFDPKNNFSIPFLWGTSGIIYNSKDFSEKDITKWANLWKSKYTAKIGMPDDMRDNFAIAMMALGYSINDENSDHLKQAYIKLKKLKPNILAYVKNGSIQEYINHEIDIGVVASGDAYKIISVDKNFIYINPKEGVKIWLDSIVIPKNAPHVNAAYKFINFILEPKISAQIAAKTGFSSPLNIAPITLPKKGEFETELNREITNKMLDYWEKVK